MTYYCYSKAGRQSIQDLRKILRIKRGTVSLIEREREGDGDSPYFKREAHTRIERDRLQFNIPNFGKVIKQREKEKWRKRGESA